MPQRLSQLKALAEGVSGAASAAEPSVADLVSQRRARPGDPVVGFHSLIEADGRGRLEQSGLKKAAAFPDGSGPPVEVIRNPIIDSLLNQGAGARSRHAGMPPGLSLDSLLRWRPSKEAALVLSATAIFGPAVILGFSVVLALVDFKGAARASAGFCHRASGNWLVFLSAAGLGLRYGCRVDVWGLVPGEFCWAPAGALLVSAAILRVLDLNEPVWNKTFLSLAAPVLSGVVVPLLS